MNLTGLDWIIVPLALMSLLALWIGVGWIRAGQAIAREDG